MKRRGFKLLVITVLIGALAPLAQAAQTVVSVTDVDSDPPITNGVTSQRENDLGGVFVPFGEDVFTFTDRSHQYNGARFSALGVLTTTVGESDIVIGLPSYLVGGEYISTRNNNRDNATFQLSVVVNQPVYAYLLLDNRIGDTVNTDPPTLGAGVMDWVINDGWVMMNTGISPNGQPDFGAVDEGGSISDFNLRTDPNANLGVGPGVLINQFWTVYMKEFEAGTITTYQQNAGGLNMYGLVIQPVPEPSTISLLLAAGLGALWLRRRRH